MRRAFAVLRLIVAIGVIAAVVGQFAKSLSMVANPGAFAANFLSFFTIDSNLLTIVMLLAGAWFGFTKRRDDARFTLFRASVTAYMATTGVVYALLLRDVSLDQATTLPWSNEILHVVAPLYVVLDWIFAPGRSPVRWDRLWLILTFPIIWLAYTLIRGPLVGWYPYPFLNPAQPGGYATVVLYIVAIAGFIGIVGVVVVWLSRLRVLGNGSRSR
ncbi:Pr6Pr family membrane protein [Microbacterium sp. STN6]|uniref:Pr6Pr family membrane protein n=1 Tax=Microbacterium sp. STN6 TaxID=2995588 RepID=UPI002260FB98|nr:Pr6Pr family membrane protein [Microbacterium sp. STN6]MCX7520748.1 Pr6Pr family membrane protein [Microbacterium sp. STN6]